MIWYRLIQDHEGLPAGATISEEKFMGIDYIRKVFFEPVEDYEIIDFVEYKNEIFCIENGIDKMLFYNGSELTMFLTKRNELQYR